jgi:hypothetical protein
VGLETSTAPDVVDPPPAPRSERVGAVNASLVLWCYALGGVVLTAGLWRHPGSRRIVGNPGDTDLYQWWLGWWAHALSSMHNPFFTDAMNLPSGVNLMSNTSMPLPALLLAPVTLGLGPLVAYNVLICAAPVASASAMMLCLRRIGVSHPAATVGGAVFGFGPAIVQSMLGHLTMSLAGLLPVLVWLNLLAWRTTRSRRTGLLLGAAAAAQLLIGEEILFQAAVGTLVVAVVMAVSRPAAFRMALPVALRAYAWALVVFVPLAGYPLYTQLFGPLRMHGSPFWVDYFAADLTSFTTSSELVWHAPAGQSGALAAGAPEHLSFIGLPLLVTCIAVVLVRFSDLRVRAAGAGFAVSAVLSMGGTLWVRGQQTTLELPYRLLRNVPLVEGALPSRFGVLTAMFAAVLLALALDALIASGRSRARTIVAFGVVVLIAATLVPKPLPVEPVADIPGYFSGAARELPEGTRAFVVPVATPQRTEPLRWQAAAHYSYSTPSGYFIAPAADGRAYVGTVPRPVEQLFVTLEDEAVVPALTPELTAMVAAQWDGWQITTVILGPSQHHDLQSQLLSQLLGGPPRVIDGVSVWTRTPPSR